MADQKPITTDDASIRKSIAQQYPAYRYDPASGQLGQDHYDRSGQPTFRPVEPGFKQFLEDSVLDRDSSTRPVSTPADKWAQALGLPPARAAGTGANPAHLTNAEAAAFREMMAARRDHTIPDEVIAGTVSGESGYDSRAQRGVHRGLFQYDITNWRRGDIYNIANQVAQFEADYGHYRDVAQRAVGGRRPEPWEVYMIHQQGDAGGSGLLQAPGEASAVEAIANAVVRATGDNSPKARAAALAQARRAITSNMPRSERAGLPVDQVSAERFRNYLNRHYDELLSTGRAILQQQGYDEHR